MNRVLARWHSINVAFLLRPRYELWTYKLKRSGVPETLGNIFLRFLALALIAGISWLFYCGRCLPMELLSDFYESFPHGYQGSLDMPVQEATIGVVGIMCIVDLAYHTVRIIYLLTRSLPVLGHVNATILQMHEAYQQTTARTAALMNRIANQ
jgi:hypothetical protein